MTSQGKIWIMAAVVAAAAAILGATNGEAVPSIAMGVAAMAFLVVGVRESRSSRQA